MSPKFEQEVVGKAGKERNKLHEARWQTRGDRATTDSDIETDLSMAEIYKDKRLFEQYKKVGFHVAADAPYGDPEAFLRMIEKWEKPAGAGKVELTDDERALREDVRGEFTTRMGIMKSCEKLLTADVFKGLGDEDEAINRLVGELGTDWALTLIKPRLINIVGENDGTESLTELWQALKDMHGVYKTNGFKKVYSRIEKYRSQYGITPAKWAEIQKGGSMGDTSERAFQEFQKQHGFFGKIWNMIPEALHSSKIGFAGWREEKNSAMVRLRETRTTALGVLGRLMSPEFQGIIDEAIKTGDKGEAKKTVEAADEKENADAKGLTIQEITTRRNLEWNAFIAGNPALETEAVYDTWLEREFQPKFEAEATAKRTGWLSQLMTSLFQIRLEGVKRPDGLRP